MVEIGCLTMVSSVDVTNQVLAEIGTRSQITAFNDGSTEGQYAGLLYNPIRDFLLREGDYDWSIESADAVPVMQVVNAAWLYSYQYPGAALRVRQPVPAVFNILDPKPVEFSIIVHTGQRYIWTKTAIASFIYTIAAIEDFWDPIFAESFRRMLGASLTVALENRLPFSKELLSEAISFAGIANLRDG